MPPLAADPVAERMSPGRLFNATDVHQATGTLDHALWERQRECAEYLDRRMADLLDCLIARGRPTTAPCHSRRPVAILFPGGAAARDPGGHSPARGREA